MDSKKRALLLLAALGALASLPACKENQHDNSRPPGEAYTDKPIQNHRFDGNESNPYVDPGEAGRESAEGGEKKSKH